MITIEQARNLKYGDILIDDQNRRWKVNGKVQRWVRKPERIRVPLKHGLYAYDAITAEDFILDEDGVLVCKELTPENE